MTRIGVTGHQRLDDPGTWPWVATAMREQLSEIGPPLIGVTSLAVGADQLLAQLVIEQGGKICAVLPFADIERSFSPENLPAYRELASQATVEVLDTSDIVLAVWNGKAAKGKGGTADVVAYAIERGVPLIHIDPLLRIVNRLGKKIDSE
jgi:hypothetical protein